MKAFLASVIGHKVFAFLDDDRTIEIATFGPEVAIKDIDMDWDNVKKQYPNLKGMGTHPVYDTPSGDLEPGCLYWATWLPDNMFWDNHKGPHLCAVLPNGENWIIDSRASNCTMPADRLHRCWCRHGEPPDITVDKDGLTCAAGAGSIQIGDYHGFLRGGQFT